MVFLPGAKGVYTKSYSVRRHASVITSSQCSRSVKMVCGTCMRGGSTRRRYHGTYMYGTAHLGRRAKPDAAKLLCDTRVRAPMSPYLDVEVQRWSDEIDVFRDVLRQMVPTLTSKVLSAVLCVFVHVVLRPEQVLRLLHRNVDHDPPAALAENDPLRADPAIIGEPGAHGVD